MSPSFDTGTGPADGATAAGPGVTDPDEVARRLAAAALAEGRPTAWFERLYRAAESGTAEVPWARGTPNRYLVSWVERRGLTGTGRRAVVVGCGLGDDAEYLCGLGFDTVAFDVAESAVRRCRERFPGSAVRYQAADLLNPPPEWLSGFDFVLESMTVQALPRSLRMAATARVSGLVAPGGTLLVLATALGPGDDRDDGPPWPLDLADVEAFALDGLSPARIEESVDPKRRWCAEFHRA